jgi:hypothetical protein
MATMAAICMGVMPYSASAAQGTGIVMGGTGLLDYGHCSGKGNNYLYIVPANQMRRPGSPYLISILSNCTSAFATLNEAKAFACSSVTMDRKGSRWPQTWTKMNPEFGIAFSCP